MRVRAGSLFWLLAICFVWLPAAAAAHDAAHADPLQLDDGVYCSAAQAGERDDSLLDPDGAAFGPSRAVPGRTVLPRTADRRSSGQAGLEPIRGPPLA